MEVGPEYAPNMVPSLGGRVSNGCDMNRRFGDDYAYVTRFTIVAILLVACIAFLSGTMIGMSL